MILKAKEIKVGDKIQVPTGSGLVYVEVKEIRTNSYYGWIGFISELYGNLSFHGWYKPDSEIRKS